MTNVRIFYSKKETAKYISHLDMTRCMTRVFGRTTLPVWYTQGFNPRIYMTFPLPLTLGTEGENECMDIRLTEEVPFEQVQQQLNAVLPQGLQVHLVAEPKMDAKEIVWGDYCIHLYCADAEKLSEALLAYLSQPAILVQKRSKKGTKEVDIAPLFTLLGTEKEPGCLTLMLRLATGINMNVNPNLLLDNFPGAVQISHSDYCRTAVRTAELELFV